MCLTSKDGAVIEVISYNSVRLRRWLPEAKELRYCLFMAFFYLDDSKHHKFGFSLAAFAVCDVDPTDELSAIYSRFGYDPEAFEFKSSAKMKDDVNLQKLRGALKSYIQRNCKIAVCIVEGDKKLGPAALHLLQSAISHPRYADDDHHIFFDEGLFQSSKAAENLTADFKKLGQCAFNFEQDSQQVMGIQLADIVAHTCSIMLLEALGHINKMIVVNAPGDTIYHGLEVELGFEMWADIRYAFLSQGKTNPKDDFDLANVEVYPWGLFIDDSVGKHIASIAMDRFGENYLGCIH